MTESHSDNNPAYFAAIAESYDRLEPTRAIWPVQRVFFDPFAAIIIAC